MSDTEKNEDVAWSIETILENGAFSNTVIFQKTFVCLFFTILISPNQTKAFLKFLEVFVFVTQSSCSLYFQLYKIVYLIAAPMFVFFSSKIASFPKNDVCFSKVLYFSRRHKQTFSNCFEKQKVFLWFFLSG